MTAIKGFCVSILLASTVGFSFWLSAVVRPAKSFIDPDPINRTIKLASQLAGTPNDQLIRNWLFSLVLTDRKDQAYEFASHTISEIQRFQAFLHINDALMTLGKTSEAQKSLQQAEWAAMSLISADKKFSARSVLLARKGELDEAINQVGQIADELARSETFADLCLYFINTRNFDAAIRSAHSAVYPGYPPRLLFQTAEALFKADQPERGQVVAKEAFDLALRVPGGGVDVLEGFAPIIVRAGLCSELLEAFHTLENRNFYIADQPFEFIAIGFAKTGNLDEALAVARGLSKGAPFNSYLNDGRARALASVSQVLREMDSKGEAEVVLTEALDTALKIDFPVHRSWALHKIAPLLVTVGREDEALRAVRGIGIGDNEPLAFVAVALAEAGRGSEAAQAAAEAFTSAHNFEHAIIRSGALLGLVKAFLKINKIDDARRLVDIAHQKLLTIKDPLYQSDATQLVAEAFALLGEWNQAVAVAEYSEQQIDRLAAYTAIIREHAITHNPALAEVLKKYIE